MEFVSLTFEISAEWDRVVYDSPDGWTFSLYPWLEMVTQVWKMENHSFALCENGKWVAVMPLHWIPAERRISSSGWGFGGPIILSGVPKPDRHRLWRTCWTRAKDISEKLGAKKITASISPINQCSLNNPWGVNPLVEAGFIDSSTHTRVVNLLPDEKVLWFGLEKDARQKIKQARSAGYSVRKCSWKEMLEDYYRIHVQNYQRTGVTPHPKAYFEGIANQPNEHHVLWAGFDPQGQPIAFHNDARFGKTAVYHTGCSESGHLKSGINYLLFWEAILGEKREGLTWYETGESFPEAISGKTKGLTDFKGKFGGELHRLFRGELVLETDEFKSAEAAAPVVIPESLPTFKHQVYLWLSATRDLMNRIIGKRLTRIIQTIFFTLFKFVKKESHSGIPKRLSDAENNIRQHISTEDSRKLFSNEGIYKAETISKPVPANPSTYAEILLQICVNLVRKYANQAEVLDVCCANGQHLIGLSDIMKSGVGMDFSEPYIRKAHEYKINNNIHNIDFVCNDAKKMPFCSSHFDVAYSFSSLYIIPEIEEVLREAARIIKPGGKCVLDLGNLYSLNELVAKAYHKDLGWAKTFPVSVPTMKKMIRGTGMKIIEHRAFQLLPLWGADRPKWLTIFLLPIWTRLFSKKINGKILDEWLSNFLMFKFFAFRHIFVCEKI
jgi:SAM-dependent methyltransferase